MKILLDENINKRLKNLLTDYDVYHVKDMGWLGKKNGELITLAVNNNFSIFISNDTNIKYQQNLSKYNMNFVVFKTPGNELDFIIPLLPKLTGILEEIKRGGFSKEYIELQ